MTSKTAATKKRSGSFPEELLPSLVKLRDDAARQKFAAAHPELLQAEVVRSLPDLVRRHARVETHEALALAEFTLTLAHKLADRELVAESLLAKSSALYLMGDNRGALKTNDEAVDSFRALKKTTSIARALNASIQPHILLGEYQQAFAAAEEARTIFRAEGNQWRLARVELNAGNIFHRQDRFQEALDCYEPACQLLLTNPDQDPEGLAVALHNMAVCLISMNDFHRALATYEKAREIAAQHRMPLLVSQADYNIAWLYYLRGEYGRAIEMLRVARENCRQTGDQYHFALCHMDLSEIYLELNLSTEAGQMAHEGAVLFEKLKMGYESAKCQANLAIALGQQGQVFRAIEIFGKARAAFVGEQNWAWPHLIDLYQALLLFNEGRYFEARRLCLSALEHFRDSVLPGKAVLAELLLARLYSHTGDLKSALQHCAAALDRTRGLPSPILNYQASCLMGEMELLSGNPEQAYHSYQAARQTLETLRSTLHREELKIGFMKNKLEVYEALIDLSLQRKPGSRGAEEALLYVEQAKSRSLLELMFKSASDSAPTNIGQSELVRKITDLRKELNWYYHRIELEQLKPEVHSPQRIAGLQAKARAREEEFVRALRETPAGASEAGFLGVPGALPMKEIRRALAPGVLLLDYFRVRERILVALLTRDSLEIVPVTLVPRIRQHLRLLQFQLSKLRLGSGYNRLHESTLLRATQEHLRSLYQELVAPVASELKAEHLVFAPHDMLHHLPFHALFDGEQYVIDRFTVSYAPSGSIYALSHRQKTASSSAASLVMGVPDAKTPCIADEIRSVARALPLAQSFLGEAATLAKLRELGPTSRFIHIATHGFFRQDNPLFSGIRLGDGQLSLYDLYQMRLPAELVTLSGCATGLNVVAAGDELLGLIRGLIHAGAQSLMLSLWDVDDQSSARLMSSFYGKLMASGNKAVALKGAMQELRKTAPHPFYWAPFCLVGKALPGS